MRSGATVEARENLFASTSWTLILAAGGSQSSDQTRGALTQLCTIYWRPVCLFFRRQGYDLHDAQDLTQGLFAELIETRFYERADRTKGRFRSFLLGASKHFLANRKDYDHAEKRGRDIQLVPLTSMAEREMEEIVARSHRLQAEDSYDREWGVTLLRRVITLLEEECRLAGKAQLFAALKGHLRGDGIDTLSYEELSRKLSRSATNLRKDVSRLRNRYRAILRDEVRQTVSNDDEVDDEVRHLRAIMAR